MKYFQLKSSQLASFQINQFFRKLEKKNRDREGVRKGKEEGTKRKRGNSKESITPANVAWRAGTTTLCLLGS
jgi:hypothetical protein